MAKREWISKEHKIFRMANGKVYARPTIPGLGRKEFPLGNKVKTLKQMIAAKDRIVADLIKAEKPKPKSLTRVEEVAEEIINLKSIKSEATFVSATIHFRKHLIPWFNEYYPYIDQVHEAAWEEYILEQYRKNPSRKLFNDRKHMAMLMRYAFRKGLVLRPMVFRNPDPERNAGRRLSEIEVERLLASAIKPDLKLQILMAVTMGMRKSEILKLSWDRVNLAERTIHLRAQDTKIRKARTMGMSDVVHSLLKQLPQESEFVFPSPYNRSQPIGSNKTAWNACKRRAKIKCRFHDLRHTHLSVTLLERKVNPLHVAVYAGVSLSEIQKTYLHPSVDDTREVAYQFGERLGENLK